MMHGYAWRAVSRTYSNHGKSVAKAVTQQYALVQSHPNLVMLAMVMKMMMAVVVVKAMRRQR